MLMRCLLLIVSVLLTVSQTSAKSQIDDCPHRLALDDIGRRVQPAGSHHADLI
jgi:hypothetical protein